MKPASILGLAGALLCGAALFAQSTTVGSPAHLKENLDLPFVAAPALPSVPRWMRSSS
ncbi:MAG: hypothetical protein HY717_13105 [Planctomycetes bacterium]|nr:hypothetical protein [Planctomycetota bacterium]